MSPLHAHIRIDTATRQCVRRMLCLALGLLLAAGAVPVVAQSDNDGDEVNYVELAARLISDGNYDRAASALRNVDPSADGVDTGRYYTLQGLVNLRRNNAQSAVPALQRAIEARRAVPADERTREDVRSLQRDHLYLAQAQFRLEHYRATIDALDEAGAVGEEIAAVHALRAQAHWNLEEPVAAFAALDRGAKLFPEDTQFLRRKVFYLIDLGFYQRAAELGLRYLGTAQAAPDDYLAIGSALRKSEQYPSALKILERAWLQYPRSRRIAVELGHVYLDQDKIGAAADIFAKAAAYHPALLPEAAELQRRAGRLQRALLYNGAIADQKKKLRQRLAIFVAMERWEQAAAMGDALRRQGLLDNGDIRYAYAYALFKAGHFERSDRMLSALTDPDLVRQATELRKAMETCRRARWKCL